MIDDIISLPQRIERPRKDDQKILNGIFWVLCSGAKWQDVPNSYAP
ncbi:MULTISPECIES: transposase [Halomonas]